MTFDMPIAVVVGAFLIAAGLHEISNSLDKIARAIEETKR